MVIIDIKNVQQILEKKITLGHTKYLSKKMKIVGESKVVYSIKICFFHMYILEKYFKDNFTIKILFLHPRS